MKIARLNTLRRLLYVVVFTTQTIAGTSTLMAMTAESNCKANGHQFTRIKWKSSFSSENAALHHAQSLEQPKTSSTQAPIKNCCSQTATPNALRMTCLIPQKPLGKLGLPKSAKNLCAKPNAKYIVGYNWACSARPRFVATTDKAI
jgi:hypothetical protein